MRSIHYLSTKPVRLERNRSDWKAANASPRVLVLIVLILGLAASALWYYRAARADKMARNAGPEVIHLSESTRTALKRLNSPLEIRFYSLLGTTGSPDALREFSGRVGQLLAAYERDAGGKITVTRLDSRSDADLDAASSDGIKAFNLNKGEPSYLGLIVAQEAQKEALPRLTPEWEQALEADLTRVILRVSGAQGLADQAEAAVLAGSTAGEEVKRAIPEFESISVEKGKEILRKKAFEELKTVTKEMQTQVAQARQQLSEAQNAKSEARQEEAMKQVQQAQAAQSTKLKEIAARLKGQITALERLKGITPSSP